MQDIENEKLVCKYLLVRWIVGLWFSLGVHVDIKHKRIELHILWFVFVIGNTESELYCGSCGKELPKDEWEYGGWDWSCPYCSHSLMCDDGGRKKCVK